MEVSSSAARIRSRLCTSSESRMWINLSLFLFFSLFFIHRPGATDFWWKYITDIFFYQDNFSDFLSRGVLPLAVHSERIRKKPIMFSVICLASSQFRSRRECDCHTPIVRSMNLFFAPRSFSARSWCTAILTSLSGDLFLEVFRISSFHITLISMRYIEPDDLPVILHLVAFGFNVNPIDFDPIAFQKNLNSLK